MRLFRLLLTCSLSWILVGSSNLPWTTLRRDRLSRFIRTARPRTQDPARYEALPDGITQHYFEQKLDHFNKSSRETFPMRYWTSTRHYRKGGPIILLLSGGAAGHTEVSLMDYGIVDILAREANGIGIMLEHRYFGKSIPVPDFTTKNMNWLTIELALQDVVNFAQTVDLGYGELTNSPNSPWFTYGGFYGGAQSAFLRAISPDVIFGSFASSAVIRTKVDFWEFGETIRKTGGVCSSRIVQLVDHIHAVLGSHDAAQILALRESFGLGALKNDLDFVQTVQAPLDDWQAQTWDVPDASNPWLLYCDALAANVSNTVTEAQQFRQVLSNFQDLIRASVRLQCPEKDGRSQIENCYGSDTDSTKGLLFDLGQTERPWTYLTCTSMGLFSTAAPAGVPSMISRLVDLKASNYCSELFADFPSAIPALPNVTQYNRYGELALGNKTDRIMFVDGERDAWLYATAHSPYVPTRVDTEQNPFKLIKGAVHQWDASGVRPGSGLVLPPAIEEIHRVQISTLKQWLSQWYRIRSDDVD